MSDEEIIDGELTNVSLTVRDIEHNEDPDNALNRRLICTDSHGETLVVTEFRDNTIPIEIEEGATYYFQQVEGEHLYNGDRGVIVRPQTTVRSVRPDHSDSALRDGGRGGKEVTTGSEITDGDVVDIELQVLNVEDNDNPKISYHAWCQDRQDRTVIVTVFEDNPPKTELREGEVYSLRNVEGERWPDGTPGVKYKGYSTIEKIEALNPAPTPAEQANSKQIIESINPSGDDAPVDRREIPAAAGTFVPGGLTALGIGVSVFTPAGIVTKVAVLIGATSLSVVSAYVSQTRPSARLRQKRQEKHLQLYLELLRQDYYSLDCVETDEPIRANVMKTDSSIRPGGETNLSILSYVGDYDESEVGLTYAPGQGSCGRAFQTGEIVYYDREQSHHAEIDMGPVQKKVVSDVESTLSVPVYPGIGRTDRPIAVLNLDSEAGVEQSKFDEDEVQNLAYDYAELVGEVVE